jgi:hypothetical protein
LELGREKLAGVDAGTLDSVGCVMTGPVHVSSRGTWVPPYLQGGDVDVETMADGTRSFPFHCQRDAGWLRGPWLRGSCGCRGLAVPWHAWLWLPARWCQPDLTLVGGLASSVAGWALG